MKTGFFKQVALGKAFILDRKLMVWSRMSSLPHRRRSGISPS